MSRIYLVTGPNDGDKKLVRAASQAQAVHRVTDEHYATKVASQDEIVQMLTDGFEVLEPALD